MYNVDEAGPLAYANEDLRPTYTRDTAFSFGEFGEETTSNNTHSNPYRTSYVST